VAPHKALTAGEQRNLKSLIENDYRRARHALQLALGEKNQKIEEEATELFPDELIGFAQEALTLAFETAQEVWVAQYNAVVEMYPQLKICPDRNHYAPEDTPLVIRPSIYAGYPGKEGWIAEQQAMAQKAYNEANSLLMAQELEAQRTVLVRGVGSQEALDVLLEIPAATDLFTTRVLELEQAPAATDE
jgi:hypothetical protein